MESCCSHRRATQLSFRTPAWLAEVVSRLEKSLTLPSSEQLSELLRVVARRYPQVMEEPSVKTLIENLEEAALQPETLKEMFGESQKRK